MAGYLVEEAGTGLHALAVWDESSGSYNNCYLLREDGDRGRAILIDSGKSEHAPALLAALARRPGDVLSREEIAAALGMPEAGERAIDVQVTRLRRKIEPDPREPRFLHTVRHRGYVLRPGA